MEVIMQLSFLNLKFYTNITGKEYIKTIFWVYLG